MSKNPNLKIVNNLKKEVSVLCSHNNIMVLFKWFIVIKDCKNPKQTQLQF